MNAKIQEHNFEEAVNKQLEKARIVGMGIGAKSVSKVVYNMCVSNKSDSEKVADIIKFCETGLKIDESKL